MNDIRNQVGVPFALEALWGMEPSAFARLRDLVASATPEQLQAAAGDVNAGGAKPKPYEMRGSTAVVRFEGVVTKRPSIWSRIFGGRAVTTETKAALDAALADDAVKSIALVIDSPGGTVNGTADLADAVHDANKKKPVVAYAEDQAASAAYWVASQAGKVYANSTSAVGSIGVFAVVPDFSRLAKNAGVEMNVVKSAPGKGAGAFGTAVTDTQLADMQREVDQIHSQFVAAVARGRGFDTATAGALADGRVHIGQAALDAGLIDGIASLDTVLAGMEPEPVSNVVPIAATQRAAATSAHTKGEPTMENTDFAAKLSALEERHSKLEEKLVAENTDLKAKLEGVSGNVTAISTDRDLEALIGKARTDAKLTKGNEEWLEPAIRSAAGKSMDAARAFVDGIPKLAKGEDVVMTDKTTPASALPAVLDPKDYIGGAIGGFDPKGIPVHQQAIAYMKECRKAGTPIDYGDAVIAVTRRSVAA